MPSEEQLQPFREDGCSNYYALALDPEMAKILPVNSSFSMYTNIMSLFSIRTRQEGRALFDVLCDQAKGSDICTNLTVNDLLMERYHDYIQAWFPTKRQSDAHLSITLSDYDIQTIRANPGLQKTILGHFAMMMKFYGFSLTVNNYQWNPVDHGVIVGILPNAERPWLVPKDHNYLRITRMLDSLTLLGLNNYPQAFKTALDQLDNQHPRIISEETKRFWANAVKSKQPPAPTELPVIADVVVRDTWISVVREIGRYFETLRNPSFIDSLFKDRRAAKHDAISNLAQVLTGEQVIYIHDSADDHYQRIAADTNVAILKDRLCTAGAVARGYISGFPDVTAAFGHSRLYALLGTIVQKQRECITGNLTPIPDAAVRAEMR